MEGLIYVVKNLVNGKSYVGQTTRKWPKRKQQHEKYPSKYSIIDRAIQKYGPENFEWTVIEKNVKSQKMLNLLEKFYIIHYYSNINKWGYNIKEGGGNGKHSMETRRKLSEINLGKKHSDETKRKLSKANKGKILSITHRKKMSENHPRYWLGKKRAEQTRRQISESQRGTLRGKYRGTYYQKKDRNPWTKVWATSIRYNKYDLFLGHFNDPISGQIIYELVWKEISNKLK